MTRGPLIEHHQRILEHDAVMERSMPLSELMLKFHIRVKQIHSILDNQEVTIKKKKDLFSFCSIKIIVNLDNAHPECQLSIDCRHASFSCGLTKSGITLRRRR